MNEQSLAMEIIAEQRTVIEEQINFYEDVRQEFLANAKIMEAKVESLKPYINGDLERISTSGYSTCTIINAMENVKADYYDMLRLLVPEDKLNELDKAITSYIINVGSKVFRQGLINGIASAKDGIE